MADVNFIKKSFCKAVECTGVEVSRLVMLFQNCICGLNYERDKQYSRNIMTLLIKMSDAQHLHLRLGHNNAHKYSQNNIDFYHYLGDRNLMYMGGLGICRKEGRLHHILDIV